MPIQYNKTDPDTRDSYPQAYAVINTTLLIKFLLSNPLIIDTYISSAAYAANGKARYSQPITLTSAEIQTLLNQILTPIYQTLLNHPEMAGGVIVP